MKSFNTMLACIEFISSNPSIRRLNKKSSGISISSSISSSVSSSISSSRFSSTFISSELSKIYDWEHFINILILDGNDIQLYDHDKHKQWKLIKEERNTAAAIGFGGAMVGFALAVASAASNSVSLVDFAIWAGVALVAQLLAFYTVRIFFMPKIVTRLESNEVSAGVILAATNVAVGLMNAACMTY